MGMSLDNVGWLSPSAELTECENWEHVAVADRIAQELDIYDEDCPSDDVLYEHGWVRISILTFMDHGYMFQCKRANDLQKAFLRKIFNEASFFISRSGLTELYCQGVIDRDEYEGAKKDE